MKRTKLLNNHGESLITVLVAVAILGLCFMGLLAGMAKFTKTNRQTTTSSAGCRDLAQNTLDMIRSNGAQSTSVETPVDSASGGVKLNSEQWRNGNLDFNANGVDVELGSVKKTRWPKEFVIEGLKNGLPPFHSNTPLIIVSSVNGLLSMYNNDPGNSCKGAGIDLSSSATYKALISTNSVDGMPAKTYLQIRPYSMHTGALLTGCPTPLYFRPYAATEPPPAVKAGIVEFNGYRADLGLEAEVVVNVQKPEGPAFACSAKSRFQYDRRKDPVGRPVLEMKPSRVSVYVDKNQLGPGAHLFCKETHYFLPIVMPPPAGNGAWVSLMSMAVSATSVGSTSSISTPWLPCDRLKVCGQTPKPSKIHVDQKHARIDLDYGSLPDNCIRTVEARAMDVVGNLSDNGTSSYYKGKPVDPIDYPPIPDSFSVPFPGVASSGGSSGAYSVGGNQFKDLAMAAKASMISGMPVKNIPGLTAPPKDLMMSQVAKQMGTALSGLSNANSSLGTATSAAATAASSLATAQSSLASISSITSTPGPGDRAAAASMASAARDAATAAQGAADQAKAAASAAHSAAATASAAASASLGYTEDMGSVAGSAAIGSLGTATDAEAAAAEADKAAAEAQKAADEAKAAADAAEAAAASASDGDSGGEGGGGVGGSST